MLARGINQIVLAITCFLFSTMADASDDPQIAEIIAQFQAWIPEEVTKTGRAAYGRFRHAPKFLPATEPTQQQIDEFDELCPYTTLACIRLLQTNPEAILAAMPNHPDYWEALILTLDAYPLGFTKEDIGHFNTLKHLYVSRMFTSESDWLLRDQALNKPIDEQRLAKQIIHAQSMLEKSTSFWEFNVAFVHYTHALADVNSAIVYAHHQGNTDQHSHSG